jgi:putative selenium metabolism hydrolase
MSAPRDASPAELERELVDFARELVATPSLSGEEGAVAEKLACRLERLGYRDVEIDGHGNVVGRLGEGPPRLMFNGHMDHVPPAGMPDPYDARIEDGGPYGADGPVLRGRGSCDMKANVAAGAYAAAFLDPASLRGGSYVFTADVKEEPDSPDGVPSLLARGIRAEFGISGESTALAVSVGHRGKIQADIRVAGRSSHASTPGAGINAVYRAVPFLLALEAAADGLRAAERYGAGTITVTGITSEPGGEVAVVPSACTIRVDRRYVPGETPESCLAELEVLVAEVAAREGAQAAVSLVNVYPLMAIDPEHPLVHAGAAAVEAVTGVAPRLTAWRFGVNATFMSEAGIPCIGIGPGNEDHAHTAQEHVPVVELVQSARIYARLIERLCDGSSSLRASTEDTGT